MITSDKNWNIYSTFLLIQSFHSLKAWFFWWLPDVTASFVGGFVSILFLMVPQFWHFRDMRRICVAIIIFIFFFYRAEGNVNSYLYSLMSAFALVPLILLKSKYQIDLLERFQKVISIILVVSLFFWLGHLFGYDLPSYDITFGQIDRGKGLEAQYFFSNYVFYLVDTTWMHSLSYVPTFFRFSSVFLEPGFLAILMVFLLFINRFDFKDRRNILYVLVIVATVSLAGFLMGVFAYIAHSIQHSRRGIAGMVIVTVLLFFSYNFFKEYNHGNNFINQGVIERLQFDEMEGSISGNNRTSVAMDNDFEKFVTTSDIWFGQGSEQLEFGVGYKAFLLKYGIVGLCIFLIYMIIITRIGRNYRANILFVLYVLMFIRGDATMLWHGFMLVYIAGVIQSKYEMITDGKNCNRITVQRV